MEEKTKAFERDQDDYSSILLKALADRLGDHLGAIKDAVQPGRRIATLRRSAELTTNVAFMDPE